MFKIQIVILLLIVGLAIGFLLTMQFRTPPRTSNPVAPVTALNDSVEFLSKEKSKLQDSIVKLKTQINELNKNSNIGKTSSQDLIGELESSRIEAGLTQVEGKGVVITLADSEGEPTTDSIVHAADLRDLVNQLWQSGAENISINDQRIVASSSIDSIINTLLINNIRITNPFAISVIGDQKKLEKELNDETILQDIHRRKKTSGLIFNIESARSITIPEYIGGYVINFARIIE